MDGRARRRLEAMRRVQEVALDLFEERGYERVTVEEIAVKAEVGPATVYRNFGTKERLVLWDEYDPMLLSAISERLGAQGPMEATREALVASLDEVYGEDRERILRRARLIEANPALEAATAADRAGLARALTAVFLEKRACQSELEAEVLAGAIAGLLDAALHHWLRKKGRTPLRDVLRSAFDSLAEAGQFSGAAFVDPLRGPSSP
ncbi:TetR/AcrR family transcriptional regulator [Archangium gephyra]|uniref:TetR/AcrR family transcriptional regulator n=1 Tax=Archangium gephyra TaxID=48 RepID=UPI0035D4BB32